MGKTTLLGDDAPLLMPEKVGKAGFLVLLPGFFLDDHTHKSNNFSMLEIKKAPEKELLIVCFVIGAQDETRTRTDYSSEGF